MKVSDSWIQRVTMPLAAKLTDLGHGALHLLKPIPVPVSTGMFIMIHPAPFPNIYVTLH